MYTKGIHLLFKRGSTSVYLATTGLCGQKKKGDNLRATLQSKTSFLTPQPNWFKRPLNRLLILQQEHTLSMCKILVWFPWYWFPWNNSAVTAFSLVCQTKPREHPSCLPGVTQPHSPRIDLTVAGLNGVHVPATERIHLVPRDLSNVQKMQLTNELTKNP